MTNYSYKVKPNRNASNGQFHGYSSRFSSVKYVVVHTGETAADVIGTDSSAEALSNYMSNATRRVSWHATTDSDSVVHNLPHYFTAFHVSGYNSKSIGIEQGIYAKDWSRLPNDHVNKMIDNLALVTAWYCQVYSLPVVWLTKEDIANGKNGIASHAVLNPETRTDPGPDFPVSLFLKSVRRYMVAPIYGIGDGNAFRPELNDEIKEIQLGLIKDGYGSIIGTPDGDAGPKFDSAIRKVEKDLGLSQTGLYTPLRMAISSPIDNIVPNPIPVPEPTVPDKTSVLITNNGRIIETEPGITSISIKTS